MGNGGAFKGHGDQMLHGGFLGLADGFGHFLGLADGGADLALFVADHDQSGEAEVLTALNNLGHAVQGHHALFPFADGFFPIPAFPTVTALEGTILPVVLTVVLTIVFIHRHFLFPSP